MVMLTIDVYALTVCMTVEDTPKKDFTKKHGECFSVCKQLHCSSLNLDQMKHLSHTELTPEVEMTSE